MLALLAAGVLAFGGLAACGDDDDTSDTGGEETTDTGGEEGDTADTGGEEGDTTDDGGGSANAEVQEYCDAVSAFVDEFDAEDPAMLSESQELQQQATDLAGAGLSAEDAEQVAECTEQLSELASELGG